MRILNPRNQLLLEERTKLMRQLAVVISALASLVGISPPESIILSEEEMEMKLQYEQLPSVFASAFKQMESYIKKLSIAKIEEDSVVIMIIQNLELFLSVLETPPVRLKVCMK